MEEAALVLSVVAIVVSGITWWQTEVNAAYSSLDELTLEMLRIGMEHPGFRNDSRTCNYKSAFSGPDLEAYECYAEMAWDICETVYDRCRRSRWLRRAWESQIADENRLHRAWFDDPGNGDSYDPKFVIYVHEHFPACTTTAA